MPLTVEIITPEKPVFQGEVDFLAAPAYDGEIGILPGHTRLLTRLGLGELRLQKGSETKFLALIGGILEVHGDNRVSVFAETAEMAGDIDLERERLNTERAKGVLMTKGQYTEAELENAEIAIKTSLLKLKVGKARKTKG